MFSRNLFITPAGDPKISLAVYSDTVSRIDVSRNSVKKFVKTLVEISTYGSENTSKHSQIMSSKLL